MSATDRLSVATRTVSAGDFSSSRRALRELPASSLERPDPKFSPREAGPGGDVGGGEQDTDDPDRGPGRRRMGLPHEVPIDEDMGDGSRLEERGNFPRDSGLPDAGAAAEEQG